MCAYAIGLDIGVASVGWATVELDAEERPCGILGLGSRIFDAAEHPQTGASLAAPRREARSARRRLRRHRHRNERIRSLFVSGGLLSREQLASLFDGRLEDIYKLRAEALDRALTAEELARVLLHLSQRRGFRSNRKNPSDKEDGELLAAVSANKARMEAGGYRTAGEMFCRDPFYAGHKRNKGGVYLATVSRDMVEDEVRQIFAAQRGFGVPFADEAFEEAYLEILLSQRSFDEGPGGDSPYGGSQIERMVGRCTLEPEEPRTAKASYSFEYFNLLEKLNHLRLVKDGASLPLTGEQRHELIELAHRSESLNFTRIRKTLSIPAAYRFNLVRYTNSDEWEEAEKKEKFSYLKAYHQMRKAFERRAKGYFATLSRADRNAIGQALTLYKTSPKIRAYLESAGVNPAAIDIAEDAGSFRGFGHLSIKACDRLIEFLEQGMNYNDACAAAGYDFKAHIEGERSVTLPPVPQDDNRITSPVVRRAVSQTIKVINAIIRKQGESPVFVNIELAREMSKDFADRKKAEKDMLTNQARNERAMERIRTEFGHSNPSGLDLVKFKLYEEQDGRCAYSGEPIPISRLFEPGFAEVDHIVPYSQSFDDSYKNKVLVLARENRNKGNRLPLQYLQGERRERFIVWVNSFVRDYRKRQLLLKERVTEEDEKRFKERNLQDTKTASRFLLNYIRDKLAFASSERKKKVTAVNGAVTSYMRKRWGINKIRADGDRHHAVDALVIACTTDGMIQQVSRYAALRECQYAQGEGESFAVDPDTGEVLRSFPYPWPAFRKELEARLSDDPAHAVESLKLPRYQYGTWRPEPIFVSRMPRRKVTGAAHKDTVKSAKCLADGLAISKKSLTALKLKDGEIENYYDPASDRLLYEALRSRLIEYGGNAQKAFAEPFYKPKSDGTRGPLVKKVKLTEPTTLNVPVQNGTGIADNDSMVRVDVFYVEGDGYYLVPIYVADTLKPELPNRACIAHKPFEQWKPMDDRDFLFSLYPNDLIRVTHKKGLSLALCQKDSTLSPTMEGDDLLLYYKGMNISVASISCITHDNTYKIGIGVKTLKKLEKYTVDVLGEYHPIGKEKRLAFDLKKTGRSR